MKNLYIDAEWFPNQQIFLIGIAFNKSKIDSLYGRALSKRNFMSYLKQVNGYIFFYGPDIGMCEKYFGIDIRNNYRCINLIRITRSYMPKLKSWKLAYIEKHLGIKRREKKYKESIYKIYGDWFHPKFREHVIIYNVDDVRNLIIMKEKLFAKYNIKSKDLEALVMQ